MVLTVVFRQRCLNRRMKLYYEMQPWCPHALLLVKLLEALVCHFVYGDVGFPCRVMLGSSWRLIHSNPLWNFYHLLIDYPDTNFFPSRKLLSITLCETFTTRFPREALLFGWVMCFQLFPESSKHYQWGFPGSSDGKVSAYNVGDLGLIPGLGRSPGEGNGNSLQYSCLEILWTKEPGGLQSMGSQRVRHNWVTSLLDYKLVFQTYILF